MIDFFTTRKKYHLNRILFSIKTTFKYPSRWRGLTDSIQRFIDKKEVNVGFCPMPLLKNNPNIMINLEDINKMCDSEEEMLQDIIFVTTHESIHFAIYELGYDHPEWVVGSLLDPPTYDDKKFK